MTYCIVDNDGIVINIIEAEADFAESIGALPYYEGADIGGLYDPPKPEPEPTVWDELDAAYQEGVDSV